MKAVLPRFIVTGIFNTSLYFSLYYLFSEGSHLPYIRAHIAASMISILSAYFLHVFYTFRVKPGLLSFVLFPFSQIASMMVQTGLLYILVHWFGISQQRAPFYVTVILFPFTYRLTRTVIRLNSFS